MTAASKPRIFLENKPTVTRIVPELAVAIGLNESILLLQIDFWIGQSDNFADGRYWTYQSLRDMKEKAFGYFGLATINRAVQSLEEQGLIVIGNYNKRKGDTTRWFALNPDGLRKLAKRVPCISLTDTLIQNETPPSPQAGKESQNGSPTDQNGSTLPETPTENKEQKEVVVARAPIPRVQLPLFNHGHICFPGKRAADFLKPAPVVTPPAPVDLSLTPAEQVRADLIALYQHSFPTQLTPTVAANLRDAISEFGAEIVRASILEAKESKPNGYVNWKYIDTIMKRRKAAPPDEAFVHPLWVTFKARWKELTTADLPDPATTYLIKRFRDTALALEKIGATEADVRQLVDVKIKEERYDYRFDYAGTDIVPIVTRRLAPRPAASAPGWTPIIVRAAPENVPSADERAEAIRQARAQRQIAQRAEAERLRALEGDTVR